jgi:hypothetical protein
VCPYSKNKESKKGLRVAQVAEHLPGKHKALSSKPSTTKNKTNAKQSKTKNPHKSLIIDETHQY